VGRQTGKISDNELWHLKIVWTPHNLVMTQHWSVFVNLVANLRRGIQSFIK